MAASPLKTHTGHVDEIPSVQEVPQSIFRWWNISLPAKTLVRLRQFEYFMSNFEHRIQGKVNADLI